MAGDDVNEERDPLLVRPYLLHDGNGDGGTGGGGNGRSGTGDGGTGDGDAGSGGDVAEESAQTWPSATTRETRSQHALEGANDLTAVIELPAGSPPNPRHERPARRRLLVLAAVVAVVLLGAGAAGFAALRDDVRPGVAAALPENPLPAVTGPQPASAPAASATPSGKPSSAPRTEGASTKPSGSTSPLVRSSASTGASQPAGTDPTQAGGKNAAKPAGEGLAADPTGARTGTIRGQNGLCLDLDGGVPVDDNHVQVYDCNGSAAQSWTVASDGTLRVQGKCALVVGDGTVHIVGCDGRTTARWQSSGQLLINASNGGCLTDPSGGARSGTGVTVTPCAGSAKQRWSLP